MSTRFRPDVRLRRRPEFLAVQQDGRRVSGRFVTVLARPNAVAHDRLGVIASRKVGGAVIRNRAKRRLRDVFRRQQPDAPVAGLTALDIVVVARRETSAAPMPALEHDVTAAIAKLRARCQ